MILDRIELQKRIHLADLDSLLRIHGCTKFVGIFGTITWFVVVLISD